tara:strand:+ start:3678 stop:4088 length:411 start_codon:yes stop_codon:yes gene_type:complete
MVNKKTKKLIKKNKKTKKKQKNKIKKGGEYKNMNIDVIISNGEEVTDEGEKRKLDFNVNTTYPFREYFKEVDAYLKKLDEGLNEFNDPNKYEKWKTTHKPKIYSYKYGYDECEKDDNAVKTAEKAETEKNNGYVNK